MVASPRSHHKQQPPALGRAARPSVQEKNNGAAMIGRSVMPISSHALELPMLSV
jgi:hypothetical protein